MPELFARRLHGRELFGHSLDGHSILRDAERAGSGPELILRMDDPAATPDFDVDSILDAVAEATSAGPDEKWEVTVVRGDRRRLLAVLPAPPLGASVVRAVEATDAGAARDGAGAFQDRVMVGEREIANGLVRVAVADDGTLAIDGGGVHLEGVGRIVDGGDFGDTYNFGPPATDGLVDRPRVVVTAATAPGPVRGTIEIVSRYDWPVGLAADGTRRSEVTAPVEVTTAVELRAGEPFVRLAVSLHEPGPRPPGPLAPPAAAARPITPPRRASSRSSSAG